MVNNTVLYTLNSVHRVDLILSVLTEREGGKERRKENM